MFGLFQFVSLFHVQIIEFQENQGMDNQESTVLAIDYVVKEDQETLTYSWLRGHDISPTQSELPFAI